ncbi:DUF2513 domain-containing protein [Streptococcus dysgalactiae]|uniref:DUF2513 domain-containing protein n=1 Tax=Streptococcus dysgalactiae TaxID=1334 RepID=UPI0021C686AD|nr:DUF2513 domain-containing protein [Streptococcus dysgalactiae]
MENGIDMKRNMELCRLVLLEIEKKYRSISLHNLAIENYDKDVVAYHCKLLFEAGLISSYKPTYADDEIYSFNVGSLTWQGHEFLDKIREDSVWNNTKKKIKDSMLPMTLDVIKDVATSIVAKMLKDTVM